LLSLPGVGVVEPLDAVGALGSGIVFRLFPLVLLPGVFVVPDEDEEDDIPPEDELGGGGVCARSAEAIAMLAIDVATPR
jgi:hypothetical protein